LAGQLLKNVHLKDREEKEDSNKIYFRDGRLIELRADKIVSNGVLSACLYMGQEGFFEIPYKLTHHNGQLPITLPLRITCS
jgi:hypothetical protein